MRPFLSEHHPTAQACSRGHARLPPGRTSAHKCTFMAVPESHTAQPRQRCPQFSSRKLREAGGGSRGQGGSPVSALSSGPVSLGCQEHPWAKPWHERPPGGPPSESRGADTLRHVRLCPGEAGSQAAAATGPGLGRPRERFRGILFTGGQSCRCRQPHPAVHRGLPKPSGPGGIP